MAVTEFDPALYEKLKTAMTEMSSLYAALYRRLNQGDDIKGYLKYDRSGLLAESLNSVEIQKKRFEELREAVRSFGVQKEESLYAGQQDMDNAPDVNYPCPRFEDIDVDITDLYTGHVSYSFLNSGKSFSKDYSDMNAFLKRSGYQGKNWLQTGTSELTNWELYYNTITVLGHHLPFSTPDAYTDKLLMNSLASVLATLPDAGQDGFTGIADWAEDVTGVKKIDGWIKQVRSWAERALKKGLSYDEFMSSSEMLDFLDQLDGIDPDFLRGMIVSIFDKEKWEAASQAVKQVGDVMGAIDILDVGFDILNHSLTDYSVQVSYLDSMKDALLNYGYSHGRVIQCIDTLKKQYEDELLYTLTKVGEKLKGEGIKQAVKGVTYFIPALKPANLILSAVSKGTGLVFAENISADKALMGLQQYDGVLTRTYEKYTQMMEKGVASPEDVKEADRLYALLTATKKKEYECMMQLSKTGSAEYNTYKAKYEELCEMMKDLSA